MTFRSASLSGLVTRGEGPGGLRSQARLSHGCCCFSHRSWCRSCSLFGRSFAGGCSLLCCSLHRSGLGSSCSLLGGGSLGSGLCRSGLGSGCSLLGCCSLGSCLSGSSLGCSLCWSSLGRCSLGGGSSLGCSCLLHSFSLGRGRLLGRCLFLGCGLGGRLLRSCHHFLLR